MKVRYTDTALGELEKIFSYLLNATRQRPWEE